MLFVKMKILSENMYYQKMYQDTVTTVRITKIQMLRAFLWLGTAY